MDSSPPTKPSTNNPRPSMASTATTARTTDHSLGSTIYGNWDQSSDIRNDLAAGWGEEEEVVPGGLGSSSSTSRTSVAASAGAQQQQQQPNNNYDMDEDNWGWKVNEAVVQPVPSFYPMDARSTRRITLSSVPTEQLEDSVVVGGGGETSSSAVVDMDETEMGGLIDEEDSSSSPSLSPTIKEVSNRISTACQSLSIYGIWDNNSSSATLYSMERVEMEINLYLDCAVVAASTQQPVPQVLLVELQRRKGCSVTFHNYRRCLLDAAEGKFNPNTYNQTDGLDKPLGRDRCNQPRASLVDRPPVLAAGGRSSSFGSAAGSTIARPGGIMRPSLAKPSLSPGGGGEGLARPTLRSPSFSADDATMPIAGLKTEGDIEPSPSITKANQSADIFEKSMKALNIAASLIRKDRVDARRLGMETLVLLTDPMRAGIETAKIASRVVLLGSACEDNTMVLETNATADVAATDDVDALFDESSGLGIRETILEMIMTEGETQESSGEISSDTDGFEGIEKEFTDSLFNLCLTVLSNALHTIEVSAKATSASPPSASGDQQDDDNNDDNSEDGDRKPSPRRRAATEPVVRPSGEHGVSKRFIDDTNSTFGCDVLSSLIRILGQAKTNPHDAYHSARCLGVLFKGCGNSHKARARRDLDAKRIIAAALEVGARSHAKLADASRVAMVALVTDDEESMEEEETKTEMEEGEIVREESETAIDEEGQQQHRLPSVLEHSQSSESDER